MNEVQRRVVAGAFAKVTDAELAALPLQPYNFHGEWNYTFNAQSDPS